MWLYCKNFIQKYYIIQQKTTQYIHDEKTLAGGPTPRKGFVNTTQYIHPYYPILPIFNTTQYIHQYYPILPKNTNTTQYMHVCKL